MSPQQWATLIVAIISITVSFVTLVRWLVKHYLYELKPNGGTSMKDQVNRLEEKVDTLYKILIKKNFEDR
ncbi:MAG: hypothetical protein WAO29_01985 [Candidatus Nanopelagicales bacterium]